MKGAGRNFGFQRLENPSLAPLSDKNGEREPESCDLSTGALKKS